MTWTDKEWNEWKIGGSWQRNLKAPKGRGLTFEVAEWREGTFAIENDTDDSGASSSSTDGDNERRGCLKVFFCAPYRVYRRGVPPMQERTVEVPLNDVLRLSGESEPALGALALVGESWLVPFYGGRAELKEAIALNRPSASIPGLSSAKARPAVSSKMRDASPSLASHSAIISTRRARGVQRSLASLGKQARGANGLFDDKFNEGNGTERSALSSAAPTEKPSQSSCSISTAERRRASTCRQPQQMWKPSEKFKEVLAS